MSQLVFLKQVGILLNTCLAKVLHEFKLVLKSKLNFPLDKTFFLSLLIKYNYERNPNRQCSLNS